MEFVQGESQSGVDGDIHCWYETTGCVEQQEAVICHVRDTVDHSKAIRI